MTARCVIRSGYSMQSASLLELPNHRIECHTLGPYATNCYIVWPKGAADPAPCWIIDASFDPEPMIASIKARNLSPVKLIYTHAHIDHIAGAHSLLRTLGPLQTHIHPLEEKWLLDPELNLSAFTGVPVTAPPVTDLAPEGTLLKLGGTQPWKVLHLPGHSPGSLGLYNSEDNVIISGDALFQGSVGRTDFPGCSQQQLTESIKTKLYTLNGLTVVLPGHGASTTIAHEKATNPYVRG